MVDKTNDLRMPFAEWLYRMYEDELPHPARALAVYVAAFKISNNDELSALSGIADRTYDKWKKRLSNDGWVIISRGKGGRGLGIEITPAYKETPVIFTDVFAANPREIYPRNESTSGVEAPVTPVKITPVTAQTPADITPVIPETPANSTGVSAENTPVIFDAQKERSPPIPPSKEKPTSSLASQREDASATEGLAPLNGSADPMLTDIIAWMPGGDPIVARRWLNTTLHTYGQEITRESYQKLVTDIASGMTIAQPLQTWSKIATRMKQEGPKRAGPVAADANSGRRERMRRFAEETEESLNRKGGR